MMPIILWLGLGLAGSTLVVLHKWYEGEDVTVNTIILFTLALMAGFVILVGACVVWAIDLIDYLQKKGVFSKIVIKGKK
jgi:hypothetical protein